MRSGLTLGVTTVGILTVSRFDNRFAWRAERFADVTPYRMRKVFHEAGNVDIVRPMAAILFVGALIHDDVYFQDAAFTSLESIFLANLFTNGLKLVIGRSRPSAGIGPDSVRPFSGARSFPSGHATTVFAFTTPWLLYYPGIASRSLFVLGVGTAVARMADGYHWFSDVLAGSLVGFGTGYLLSRRHQQVQHGLSMVLSVNRFSIIWKI